MRPRVLLNCAASLDGRLAAPDGAPLRLSDETDLRRVHAMRAEADAILVGVGTVLCDDPSLRVKPTYAVGPDPLRVVLDSHGRTPLGARVVDGSAPSLVLHGPEVPAGRWPCAQQQEVRVVDGHLDLEAVLEELGVRGVRSLMVEGGSRVLRAFLEAYLVDRWTIYQAPLLVGGDGPCLWPGTPMDPVAGPPGMELEQVVPQGAGVLWTFRRA